MKNIENMFLRFVSSKEGYCVLKGKCVVGNGEDCLMKEFSFKREVDSDSEKLSGLLE
jgi:hypothetical protein